MAVAEPATREEHSHVTFRTIGGILLIAFLAASVGFYVHTTSASSEDNPRDMMPGYVVNVRNTCFLFCVYEHSQLALQSPTQALSMGQDGTGTLSPTDSDAHYKQRLSQGQPKATSAAAGLRGSIQNAAAAVRQSPINRRIKNARGGYRDAAQNYDAKHKAALQLSAHQRLSDQGSEKATNFPRPSVVLAREAAKLAASPAAKAIASDLVKAYKQQPKAVEQVEKSVATDLVKAFKCAIGTDCLTRNLVDAEKAVDKFLDKTVASDIQSIQHKKAASVLHNMGAKFKKPKSAQLKSDPTIVLGPAGSKNFWKEAAEIAEVGPDHAHHTTKNSAKTFVKQLAAAMHDAARGKAEVPAAPVISNGPMSSIKSKTF
jgi:hypothetical protein